MHAQSQLVSSPHSHQHNSGVRDGGSNCTLKATVMPSLSLPSVSSMETETSLLSSSASGSEPDIAPTTVASETGCLFSSASWKVISSDVLSGVLYGEVMVPGEARGPNCTNSVTNDLRA